VTATGIAPDTTILVVDDDDGNRYFKSHVLRGAGFRVCEAARGDEGLWQVERERPNVVVLDMRLPDMNGLDVCRVIKTRHPSTLVLQTSAAFTDPGDKAAGLAGGADSYLVEPLDHSELVAVVQALLRLHRAEQELRSVNETLEQRVAERTRALAEANERLAEEAQKRAKIEEALRHAEKLDAIGQLTGGVAHDFNNLLTVVVGNLDLVEQYLGGAALPVVRLGELVSAARRAAFDCERLTRQLLAFARRDALRVEVVDLNALILRFLPLLQRAVGEQVIIEPALGPGLRPCRVDPKQFETALLNLAVNARDAMPLGGPVRLATANHDSVAVDEVGAMPPGAYVHVEIADSGSGMSEDVLERAFEPFFTTKDIGQGSGLGLSQVYGFVRQSGGHITVESTLGRGTRVNLFLPSADTLPAPIEDAPAATEAPRGSETVLIVEDNDLVLEVAVTMIEGLGYRTLVADSGKAALDIIIREPGLDLLFSDVVMPHHMSGVELARTARRLRPDLKVLLTSGYSAYQSDASAVSPDEFPSIAKPYHRAELAVRLRQVLDG
jgi:signal transduction histidine kinase